MKINLLLMIIVSLFLNGCKKAYKDEFDFVIHDGSLCAIKNEKIKSAKIVNWIYPEIKNLADTVVSSELKFDKDVGGFLVCTDINALREKIKNGAIRTSIGVEVGYGSYTEEYNLINYSCISSRAIKLNISKDEAFEECN